MISTANKQEINPEGLSDISCLEKENEMTVPSVTTLLTHPNPTTQLLLTSKPLIHTPEAGLNPLVDAAAYLFSIMGKLKQIKQYKNLDKLQIELLQEIENFQETVQTYSYSATYLAEYIPITTYALSVTLDEIILNTPWGNQGLWDEYSLVKSYNQEPLSPESFLIILERLVRDPDIYIDVMEFMYICLSLGLSFRQRYNPSDFGHEQLEQITNALYKRIRAYRGNFNKILSPFTVKQQQRKQEFEWRNIPGWMAVLLSSFFLITLFFGGRYLMGGTSTNQTIQNSTQMELKS
jgi:type VI secretion system protein ImpK